MTSRTHWAVVALVALLSLTLAQLRASAASRTHNLREAEADSNPVQAIALRSNIEEQASPSLFSDHLVSPAAFENSPGSLPDWVEPRGISVAELVGQIPDDYLRGMIISSGPSTGIVVYESGSRVENTVVLTTTIYPRIHTPNWPPHNLVTLFGCLGQTPHFDHIGSVVPASLMRVYSNDGTDVTDQVQFMDISRLGLDQPLASSEASFRYPVDEYGAWKPFPLPMGPDGLQVPANGGCIFEQPGVDSYPLTGVFTYTVELPPEVTLVGTQQATFKSFIGPADVGIFQPLMTQLQNEYGDRHDRIPLSFPEEASHFLIRFPPMPADPYTDRVDGIYDNADRLSAGTYRLSKWVYLSTDLTYSGVFPLSPAWQDADRAPEAEFLPLMPPAEELATPEYVIPAGVPYDSCFTQGNCPSDVLEQIYHAEMTLEILYLSLAMPEAGGEWLSLKMAGPCWQPSGPVGQSTPEGLPQSVGEVERLTEPHSAQKTLTYTLYLPIVAGNTEPDVPGECPCGWFDSMGRMLYYHP